MTHYMTPEQSRQMEIWQQDVEDKKQKLDDAIKARKSIEEIKEATDRFQEAYGKCPIHEFLRLCLAPGTAERGN